MDFFQGQSTVPWSLWWKPLAAWLGFFMALFSCALCLIAIVQRQWITNERLAFPLAQVPLEMVREDAQGVGVFPGRTAWVFWLGVLLAGGLGVYNGLAARFPILPAIPTNIVAMQPSPSGWTAGLGEIDLAIIPWMVALAFLIPKELSFSCWFFWIVNRALTVLAVMIGVSGQVPDAYSTAFPACFYQGGGVALALLIWVLWGGRRHLSHALRLALRPSSAEAEEPMSYRWAGIVLLISFAFMVYFCYAAGCRLWFGMLLVGLIVAYYGMWARLRAETGMGFLPFPLEIGNGITSLVGSRTLLPRELVTMISVRWSYFPGFGSSSEVLTGNALESYKIADAAGINARRLTRLMMAIVLVALVFGAYVLLTGFYREGYFGTALGNAVHWPPYQTLNDGTRIFTALSNAKPARSQGLHRHRRRRGGGRLSRRHAPALLVVAVPSHRLSGRELLGHVHLLPALLHRLAGEGARGALRRAALVPGRGSPRGRADRGRPTQRRGVGRGSPDQRRPALTSELTNRY